MLVIPNEIIRYLTATHSFWCHKYHKSPLIFISTLPALSSLTLLCTVSCFGWLTPGILHLYYLYSLFSMFTFPPVSCSFVSSVLLLLITIPSVTIIVQEDSCLTSSVNLSIKASTIQVTQRTQLLKKENLMQSFFSFGCFIIILLNQSMMFKLQAVRSCPTLYGSNTCKKQEHGVY